MIFINPLWIFGRIIVDVRYLLLTYGLTISSNNTMKIEQRLFRFLSTACRTARLFRYKIVSLCSCRTVSASFAPKSRNGKNERRPGTVNQQGRKGRENVERAGFRVTQSRASHFRSLTRFQRPL